MIFLDVDEVVADFLTAAGKEFPEIKRETQLTYELPAHINWQKFYDDMSFWLILPVLDRPTVQVAGYISHRPFPTYITEFWLHINRFERAPVYHVDCSTKKVRLLQELGATLYVDDKPSTFESCTAAGINTYLYTQPWNQHIQTEKRISKLVELENLCNK